MFVTREQLQTHFKCVPRKALKLALGRAGVHFFTDSDGWPFTTQEAINAALGLNHNNKNSDGFDLGYLEKK